MENNKKKAYLILEDGTVFSGYHIGAEKQVVSEIVFNTSMTGYVEVLTDPSYAGQAVAMTYPLIGNYGVNYSDMESDKAWPDAFIVREIADVPSNFRCETDLNSFLTEQGIPGVSGIDVRALTLILREKGTMNGMITTDENVSVIDGVDSHIKGTGNDYVINKLLPKIKDYKVQGVVKRVSSKEIKDYTPGDIGSKKCEVKRKIALIDVGTKKNIIRSLLSRGNNVRVYPATFDAKEVIEYAPDGIMISNGPGDPSECVDIINEIKVLKDAHIPIFAICLGHQLMALSHDAKTYKMKYGHRGANHPVKDMITGKVYISTQNHGYVVDEKSFEEGIVKPWFINVNDKTLEGLIYEGKNIKTVQFHPEACAGPLDTGFLFEEFEKMMER
jgi:carbamoyl-phosphate synthase small subunit